MFLNRVIFKWSFSFSIERLQNLGNTVEQSNDIDQMHSLDDSLETEHDVHHAIQFESDSDENSDEETPTSSTTLKKPRYYVLWQARI